MIFLQQETVSIPTAMKHITLLIIITALTLFIIAAGAVYMLFSKKRKQSGKEKEILAQLAQVTDPIKGMMEAEKDPRQKALYRQHRHVRIPTSPFPDILFQNQLRAGIRWDITTAW